LQGRSATCSRPPSSLALQAGYKADMARNLLLALAAMPAFAAAALHYKIDGSAWASEISWDLSCSDGATATGGGVDEGTIDVSGTAQCVLSMEDSYGDGWNGGSWKALCGSASDDFATLDFSTPDYGPYSIYDYAYTNTETFELLCIASPPVPPAAPPAPPLPPMAPSQPLHYKIDGSTWASEISWSLACSGGVTASGGGEDEGTILVGQTAECLLTMEDSFGDGWNGGSWKALCGSPGDDFASLDFSTPDYGPFSVEYGYYSSTVQFSLLCLESPPSPPVTPPASPTPPHPAAVRPKALSSSRPPPTAS